jgi:hypothetical protein
MPDLNETFRDLDLRVKSALADQKKTPLRMALAALSLAHDEAGVERVSVNELHEALRSADVSVKREPLARALGHAGDKVTTSEVGGVTKYRVSVRGRPDAAAVLGAGDLELMYIDGSTPRTDRQELGKLLGDLKGDVRVCDPWYGVRSLETLELFPTKSSVKFMTARTNEKPAKVAGPMKDFKKERANMELRAAGPGELHDRYVLTDRKLMIVGHGLKDIGAKESFIVMIERDLAPDLLGSVRLSFDEKWARATPI